MTAEPLSWNWGRRSLPIRQQDLDAIGNCALLEIGRRRNVAALRIGAAIQDAFEMSSEQSRDRGLEALGITNPPTRIRHWYSWRKVWSTRAGTWFTNVEWRLLQGLLPAGQLQPYPALSIWIWDEVRSPHHLSVHKGRLHPKLRALGWEIHTRHNVGYILVRLETGAQP